MFDCLDWEDPCQLAYAILADECPIAVLSARSEAEAEVMANGALGAEDQHGQPLWLTARTATDEEEVYLEDYADCLVILPGYISLVAED